MKLNSFKFQDGKVFWLPEYPEKEPPAYEFINPEDDLRRRYDQAVAQSLASAIEVDTKGLVIERQEMHTNRTMQMIMVKQHPFIYEELREGKVYSAECEIKIVEQWALKGTQEWYNDDDERFELHHPDDTDYRQVARLKLV